MMSLIEQLYYINRAVSGYLNYYSIELEYKVPDYNIINFFNNIMLVIEDYKTADIVLSILIDNDVLVKYDNNSYMLSTNINEIKDYLD
jgi:hypothetical protein